MKANKPPPNYKQLKKAACILAQISDGTKLCQELLYSLHTRSKNKCLLHLR